MASGLWEPWFWVHTQDAGPRLAGVVQPAAVELQADDGKHEDGKEEQQADLQQRNHGLHDGFQDNLQTWKDKLKKNLMVLKI